jgi:hypothetical protein
MKKITQNLTNTKAWQSTIFAFMFLFSLTIYAQEAGDEFLANAGVNTTAIDADTGYDGAGTFNANNGYGGWGAGTGGAYASATTANGDCHSPNRMFRLFKTGGPDGQFVNQTITALPAGNYNFGFWNKWDATSSNDEALPTWSAEGDAQPKFTIKVQNAEGGWTTVHTHIPAEPTADMTWVEETGTWTNDEVRDVRVMFYKNGGTGAAPSNINNLWYVDTTTLNFASALETSSGCDLSINMIDSYGDSWNGGQLVVSVNGVEQGTYANTADAGAGVAQTVALSTSYGDEVTFDFTCGSYCGETSFNVTDADGNVVASGGGSDTADGTFSCLDPDAINFSASATTDGGSATFSFSIDNFVVGEAGEGVDGHIHWSIFDSLGNAIVENVMVYSAEDYTLNDLPNGDHTIVFSLVDSNHTALDPPVEATVEFSTFDGTAACGETVTYTQVNSSTYSVSITAPEGQVVSVTVNGQMEANWDSVVFTDGSGVSVSDQTDGVFADVVVTSTDGSMNITVTNDSSVNYGDITFAFACANPQYNVTFSVNTANITVGDNGMYLGGGVMTDLFGNGAQAVQMSDEDGDGTWTVVLALDEGTTGFYTFLNSPNDGGDWGAKEDLSGQECGDAANNNDRTLAAVTADAVLLHCFGSCETDGTCPEPATTSAVTFNVDMNAYGLADGDTVHVNGEFTGWCGSCGNEMSDEDGDGVYTITMDLEPGSYFWKYTVNGWGAQESFSEGVDGCTADNNGNFDRQIVVGDDAMDVSYCYNTCDAACPAESNLEFKGVLDFSVNQGANAGGFGSNDGKAVHVLATGDIADMSIYSIVLYANGNTDPYNDFTFPAISASAGDEILVARSVDAQNYYMDASSFYTTIVDGGSWPTSNGNDALELISGTEVIDVFGIVGDNPDTTGSGCATDDCWDHEDAWAYKADGVWTYGEVNCTDGTETICESSCVYPFVLSLCVTTGIEPGCSDFEGDDGAAGWTVVDAAGNTSDWMLDTTPGADDTQSMGHGYLPSTVAYNDWLVSPGYNTTGLVEPALTYEEYLNWSADAGEHNVYYSTDYDGDATTATWVLLNNVIGADAEDVFTSRTFALPSDFNVVIGFQYLATYGADWNIDNVCIGEAPATPNAELIALLESGVWRAEAETYGHMGVGPNQAMTAEWWNANPWDKWETGFYDDRWTFAAGTMTHDSGEDGSMFGKKPALDAAFPDNTPYDADNGDNEYLYYTQDDYTDTYTVSDSSADAESVTMSSTGQIGFFVGGGEYLVLERTETTMYLRNVGEDTNSWYHRLTTADALSTVDVMALEMVIYPNPTNSGFVTIQTPVSGVKNVEVYDINGRRVMNTSLNSDTLNVSSISAGMYLVKVTIEGQSKTSKLIIR